MTKTNAAVIVLGMTLGFSLSRIGFTDYGELSRMLSLRDLRLFFVFIGAVILTGIGFRVLALRFAHVRGAIG